MSKSGSPRWTADLSLALVALVWGATFVIVKRALTEISTLYFLAVRFWLAAACMLGVFLPSFRRTPKAQIRQGLRAGIIAGVLLWLGYVLQSFGLKYTSAGNSGFLTGFYIVLVPIISAVLFRRRPQTRELLGIAMAAAGVMVMSAPNLDSHARVNRGDLLTIGCAVVFAFHLLVLGYFSQREYFQAVALGQIACTALLSTVSLVFEPPQANWSTGVIWAIVITAVFATTLAFALQTWAQQYTTATRTALIFALEPVFALVVAVAIGGEPITPSAGAGGGLILAGILAVELKPGLLS